MTENEFRQLAAAGFNRIPLHLETLADLDTPLSIYLKLANAPGSYLLESVIGGERFEVGGGRVTLSREGEPAATHESADPLADIDAYLASFRAAPLGPRLRF